MPATTWPFRRRPQPVRPSDEFAGAGRLSRSRQATTAPAAPDMPTEDVPTLDDYAGLPAEGLLGFEQPSYTFLVEVGETEQPTPDGRILLGKVTARTAGYESPTAYYLEAVPVRTNLDITPDGSIWWIADNYPTYQDAIFPPPPTDTQLIGDIYLLVGARLRDQRVRATVAIRAMPLPKLRMRDGIPLNAEQRPTTNVSDAGWTYTAPTPAPLPAPNFTAIWTFLTNIPSLLRFQNPFSADDLPFSSEIGGVRMQPGYILLRDLFIDRVSDTFILEYDVEISVPTIVGTDTQTDQILEATIKPFCPRIDQQGSSSDRASRLARARSSYGIHAVWAPTEAHEHDLEAHLTVTATTLLGEKYSLTWIVYSRNLGGYAVPIDDQSLTVPTHNTLTTGDMRLPLFAGVEQTEHYLQPNSDLEELVFNLAFMDVYDDIVGVCFLEVMQNKLGILDGGTGRFFEAITRGKLVAWQISWATTSDSGSYLLLPRSADIYQYAPIEAGELVVNPLGSVIPPGTLRRGYIGTQTQAGVTEPDSTGNVAESLGPHLKLKMGFNGDVVLSASDTPGSTLVQIVPYVLQWNAWYIPVPYVGGALARLLSRFSSLVVRSASRRLVGVGASKLFSRKVARQYVGRAVLLRQGTRDMIGKLGARATSGVARAGRAVQREGPKIAADFSTSKATEQLKRAADNADRTDKIGSGFSALQTNGLAGPPFIGSVMWEGDYLCGLYHTVDEDV